MVVLVTCKNKEDPIKKRRFFFTFSYCKSTGDDGPRGVANLDPMSMIGRIYVGHH